MSYSPIVVLSRNTVTEPLFCEEDFLECGLVPFIGDYVEEIKTPKYSLFCEECRKYSNKMASSPTSISFAEDFGDEAAKKIISSAFDTNPKTFYLDLMSQTKYGIYVMTDDEGLKSFSDVLVTAKGTYYFAQAFSYHW